MEPPTLDILVKVLISLFSAALGAYLKTYSDRRRLRMLFPIMHAQIKSVALKCTNAFSINEAKAVEATLETACKMSLDLVGLGVRPVKTWKNGTLLLLQTCEALKEVTVAQSEEKAIKALGTLRDNAAELNKWVILIENKTRM